MRKLWLWLGLINVLFILGACNDVKAPGLYEISYKELLKKLEANETFWLVTLDAKPELIKAKDILSLFEEGVNQQGIPTYYVNIYGQDLAEKEHLETAYLHPFMSDYGGGAGWDASTSGFVYVKNGGVISMSDLSNFSASMIETNDVKKHNVYQNITKQLQLMDEYGVSYQITPNM